MARVGSAGFRGVQILMLLDFVTAWNDAWVDKEDDRWVENLGGSCLRSPNINAL